MKARVYILLGSNLGEREYNLANALNRMSGSKNLQVIRSSCIYESRAYEMEPGTPDFLNQAVELLTEMSPAELLDELESIERDFGRTDKGKNKSRTIDLDILLFGEQVIDSDSLIVPYRQLLNRPFAMIPLVELAPQIVHPILGEMITDYIEETDYKRVTKLLKYAAE